jgi:hypothetical protein
VSRRRPKTLFAAERGDQTWTIFRNADIAPFKLNGYESFSRGQQRQVVIPKVALTNRLTGAFTKLD